MLNDLIEATHITNYRVRLRFEDGTEGELDLADLIRFDGIFAQLKDPSTFAQLYVDPDVGTICWPNGADIAPETLYAALAKMQATAEQPSGTQSPHTPRPKSTRPRS